MRQVWLIGITLKKADQLPHSGDAPFDGERVTGSEHNRVAPPELQDRPGLYPYRYKPVFSFRAITEPPRPTIVAGSLSDCSNAPVGAQPCPRTRLKSFSFQHRSLTLSLRTLSNGRKK
ncbi:MAG: hypothetical protein Q4G49_06715 [Paracoccus sp. (in: a-proteobacteria)]|nr:hypothetical protein [Paracoccus sp. (in: a-proteobacteria)]